MTEVFVPIPRYEGYYEVSKSGNVRSVDRVVSGNGLAQSSRVVQSRLMVRHVDTRGYACVCLSANGTSAHHRVHRLVMSAFSPNNAADDLDVNHINGDKLDNNLENLEWVTRSENLIHRYRVLGQKHSMTGKFGGDHHRSVRVVGVNRSGEAICSFPSLMDAERAGYRASKISNCLSGKRKTHAGLSWTAPDLTQFV